MGLGIGLVGCSCLLYLVPAIIYDHNPPLQKEYLCSATKLNCSSTKTDKTETKRVLSFIIFLAASMLLGIASIPPWTVG